MFFFSGSIFWSQSPLFLGLSLTHDYSLCIKKSDSFSLVFIEGIKSVIQVHFLFSVNQHLKAKSAAFWVTTLCLFSRTPVETVKKWKGQVCPYDKDKRNEEEELEERETAAHFEHHVSLCVTSVAFVAPGLNCKFKSYTLLFFVFWGVTKHTHFFHIHGNVPHTYTQPCSHLL